MPKPLPRPVLLLFLGLVLALSPAMPLSYSAEAAPGWPQFRGPTGDGIVGDQGSVGELPVRWSEDENVRWKTAIHDTGWSTPVALEGKVWLTTATRDGHTFFALAIDAETGNIVFDQPLFECETPEPLGNNVNGYASSSPTIEPGRVYIHFGSYGTACLDTETYEVLWLRTDLECRHYRGPGSSAILFEQLLILTFDGVDQQYVVALDKTTGKTVWKTPRTTDFNDLDKDGKPFSEGDLRKGFTTPIVIDWQGAKQLINPGSRTMYAYDPYTGKELWKVRHHGHSTSASTVFAGGLAMITTGYEDSQLWAVRVDGRGDVTDSHVAWKVGPKDVPQTPSPITLNNLVFMVSNTGALTCMAAETGEVMWRERISGGYIASPIAADGRIYFFNQNGKTTIIEADDDYREIAVNEIDEGLMSSPAVYGDSLILRTKTDLYRIQNSAAAQGMRDSNR
jgi:outer membrane protein assembly factor BamB